VQRSSSFVVACALVWSHAALLIASSGSITVSIFTIHARSLSFIHTTPLARQRSEAMGRRACIVWNVSSKKLQHLGFCFHRPTERPPSTTNGHMNAILTSAVRGVPMRCEQKRDVVMHITRHLEGNRDFGKERLGGMSSEVRINLKHHTVHAVSQTVRWRQEINNPSISICSTDTQAQS